VQYIPTEYRRCADVVSDTEFGAAADRNTPRIKFEDTP